MRVCNTSLLPTSYPAAVPQKLALICLEVTLYVPKNVAHRLSHTMHSSYISIQQHSLHTALVV